MALTRTERENLVIALFVEGLNVERARNQPEARYAWQTVKNVKVWFETLRIEEAQHLQDESVRDAYERLHGVQLLEVNVREADGTSELGLLGYLRGVRREIAALSTQSLEEGLRRREKYDEIQREMSPWPPAIYVPFQRSWSVRGGVMPLFIADHCPELVEVYDAFGEAENALYYIFKDQLTLPVDGSNGGNAVKAAERRYDGKKKLLLAVLVRLCAAKELPGQCPYCPDHSI